MAEKILITVGSREDLSLFSHRASNQLHVNWTVPKEADVGNRIYFLIPSRLGPIQGYGTVDEEPYPSDKFAGRYQADVVDLQILNVPVRLDDLQNRFPDWPYLYNAKGYTYVPDDLVRDFKRFVDEYQNQPDWLVLGALESRERMLDIAEVEENQGQSIDGDEDEYDYEEWEEDNERVPVSIKRRRGQATFRSDLRVAYNNTCAVTKYNSHHSLEAAHIRPYQNRSSNSVSNGLLLRADIHTLFDLDLLGIDQDGKIVLSNLLLKTPSGEKNLYFYLDGQQAKLPVREEHRPNANALQERLKRLR